MKTFFAIYLGSENAAKKWDNLDAAARAQREKEGINAWMKWGGDNKNAIVDIGSPIGKTKRVDSNGIADTQNQITGYVIVRANSHEEAAKMFVNHPHFSIFPGDSVEIMECLPLPEVN